MIGEAEEFISHAELFYISRHISVTPFNTQQQWLHQEAAWIKS